LGEDNREMKREISRLEDLCIKMEDEIANTREQNGIVRNGIDGFEEKYRAIKNKNDGIERSFVQMNKQIDQQTARIDSIIAAKLVSCEKQSEKVVAKIAPATVPKKESDAEKLKRYCNEILGNHLANDNSKATDEDYTQLVEAAKKFMKSDKKMQLFDEWIKFLSFKSSVCNVFHIP
ncbi:hypothetical protein PFISCL1PPCAC_6712, partial [Pristionchus fissidentatus]